MKGKKKYFLIGSIVLLLLIVGIIAFYFYLKDEGRLSASERRFLANNSTTVQNINILNNVNIFGKEGSGVFYDFLEDFSKDSGLKTNPVTYNLGEPSTNVAFSIGNMVNEDEFVFYEGHYVLISKKSQNFSDVSHLTNQKIGILNENLSYVSSFLNTQNLTIKSYNSEQELLEAFQAQTDIQYMIVPLCLNIETILKNDFYVAYHFSDIPYFYKINISQDKTLGTILKKFFLKWEKDKLQDSYKNHLFRLFQDSLNISQTEIDAMQSITYNYGFITNSPYEILSGGNYGGIIAQYLKEFIDFSDTEIKFTKYKNTNKLGEAIKNDNIDLYFAFYNVPNNFVNANSNININYNVIMDKEIDKVIHSLKSLNNVTAYVEENSILYEYLKSNSKIDLKTYKNEKELKKLVKNQEIIIVDDNVYYAKRFGVFNEYSVRFSETVDTDYLFKIDTNETFTKLFTKFINIKDPDRTEYKGIYNYELTFRTGRVTGAIAKYFMYILIIFVLVFLYAYKLTKKIKLSKKIKKEDKLKYIDQLTSLKNRNYLSENLENWSQNKIYPQSVVVIDLNNLQYINDTQGYEKGDEQIKAAANILVKAQLDNSDIIRTDGNEFVIYLIGYQQKQLVSYIHKLNKEFKKLPFEQGAAIGYSMIEDDIKTVEDAINEAVEEVKKQKENKKEGNA